MLLHAHKSGGHYEINRSCSPPPHPHPDERKFQHATQPKEQGFHLVHNTFYSKTKNQQPQRGFPFFWLIAPLLQIYYSNKNSTDSALRSASVRHKAKRLQGWGGVKLLITEFCLFVVVCCIGIILQCDVSGLRISSLTQTCDKEIRSLSHFHDEPPIM